MDGSWTELGIIPSVLTLQETQMSCCLGISCDNKFLKNPLKWSWRKNEQSGKTQDPSKTTHFIQIGIIDILDART